MTNTYNFQCHGCKKKIRHTVDESGGAGFTSVTVKGETEQVAMCYVCSGILDARNMIAEGKIQLYLVRKVRAFVKSSATGWYLTNWPGTLVFNIEKTTIVENVGAVVWFMGPEGMEWSGVRGAVQELAVCKRTDRRINTRIPKHGDYIVQYPYTEIRP